MYTDYYGLTERPFQLTPDARFWFESRTHKKAMAYLGYGLAQGEGFIVITGEVGAGKSTLVAHLLATIDRERLNAIHIASTQVGGDDLLRLVAQGLGIATAGTEKARLLDAVEQRLGEEARRGRRTLLIVDEAQNLSVPALEELRMLSNFTSQSRALIQTLLLGQPEFRDRIGGDDGLEQLRQRVIASHHLEPIEANEVEPYLVHRLACAGWQGRPGFAADAFAALYRHSGGVPRRLNQLANRLLLQGAVEQADGFDGADVERVLADLAADAPQRPPAVHAAPEAQRPPTQDRVRDITLERRIAALEARANEQEVIVRRVLTLLVEWVENGQQAPGYTNAA
ncbi:MAG: ral secretion pathway protein [Sphingomonadales bacterium]|jgi:putative secretion ATPase (PEP-CTERM system associated)|nr:ral secretion pathway protein [Sphingomonadales bacterium]